MPAPARAEGAAESGPPPPPGPAEPPPLTPETEDALPSQPPTPVPAAPQQLSLCGSHTLRSTTSTELDPPTQGPGAEQVIAKAAQNAAAAKGRGRRGGRGRGRGRHMAVAAPPPLPFGSVCADVQPDPANRPTGPQRRAAAAEETFQAGLVSLEAVSLEDEIRKRVHTLQSVLAKLYCGAPSVPLCKLDSSPGLETVHACSSRTGGEGRLVAGGLHKSGLGPVGRLRTCPTTRARKPPPDLRSATMRPTRRRASGGISAWAKRSATTWRSRPSSSSSRRIRRCSLVAPEGPAAAPRHSPAGASKRCQQLRGGERACLSRLESRNFERKGGIRLGRSACRIARWHRGPCTRAQGRDRARSTGHSVFR